LNLKSIARQSLKQKHGFDQDLLCRKNVAGAGVFETGAGAKFLRQELKTSWLKHSIELKNMDDVEQT
jgi:hypothetical protein